MNDADFRRAADSLERIGLVLGALYASSMGDLDQKLKALRLNGCGFSNTEIAHLLGVTPNAVKIALHRARKGKAGRSRKRNK